MSSHPLDPTHPLPQTEPTSLAADDSFLPSKPYFDGSDVGSHPPKFEQLDLTNLHIFLRYLVDLVSFGMFLARFGEISLCLAKILPKMA